MAEQKSAEFDADATSGAIPRVADKDAAAAQDPVSPPEEEMNSTQMAIDIGKLNLDSTRADIRIKPESDEEVVRQKIEEKKNPVAKVLSTVFASNRPAAKKKRAATDLSPTVQRWLYIWICDPDESTLRKMLFYLHRLVLLVLGAYLQFRLIQHVLEVRGSSHPALNVKMIGVAAGLMGSLIFLVLRASPAWLVVFPLSVISVLSAYGAYAFHTRDLTYFNYFGRSLSDMLNGYYLLVLVPAAISSIFVVGRALFTRLLFFILYSLVLFPFVANAAKGLTVAASLFGYDFLPDLPAIAQPTFLVLHGLLPFLALIHLFFGIGRSREGGAVIGRGFSLATAFLLMCASLIGFAVMQENRVATALNFILPPRLNVGGVELEIMNQTLKVETANYGQSQGSDTLPRYRFLIEPSREAGSFVLQSVDEFGVPVRNLTTADLVVMADDQRIRNFELIEFRRPEALKKYLKTPDRMPNIRNAGVYVLKLKLEAKQQILQWSKIRDGMNTDESITFEIGDLRKIHGVRFKVKDETLLDVTALQSSSVVFPLSYFAPGEHTLIVALYDEGGVEVLVKEIPLKIAAGRSHDLVLPLEGDTVATRLPVVVLSRVESLEDVSEVHYVIDDVAVKESKNLESATVLDVSSLSEGAHTLAVRIKTKSGDVERKVSFNTIGRVPRLEIDSPAMGSFAGRDTRIHFGVDDGTAEVAGLKVWVNGEAFEDFKISENGLDLPVSRWSHAELNVALQATLKTGERISDWVLLNKGQGELKLTFDKLSLGFLNYKKISLVLDGSVSMYDNWLGSSKWMMLRNLVTHADVEQTIEKMDPAFVVFGSRKPQYLNDCQDAEFAVKHGRYDKTELGKILSSLKPSGVSALTHAIGLALDESPERIIVFTDGADSCKSNLTKSLAKALKKYPATSIDIFALGMVDDKIKNSLQTLAQETGGLFYQPQNVQLLQKALLDRLTVVFKISAQDKVIYQGPLENRSFDLVPGTYALQLSAGGSMVDVGTFQVSNGLVTSAGISGIAAENKIQVDENFTQN